ncbi:MAG: sugar phosphate isomerase/epimerase [Methylotenera sp.]|nr:sugar phosphate isomerase/epimerase [Methylotenera sp.]
MRLAISNIAWDVSEDVEVASLLKRYGVDAIDIAPGKYFPNPAQAADEDIAQVKLWWAAHGIEITGMQALLFGTQGLNVFGSPEVQGALLKHLAEICRIASKLNATRLVFGSPKNRDCSGLSKLQTQAMATSFFRQLGDIAQSNGVVICLEPNPTCYGANFMVTSDETANMVALANHPSIRMQLDTGAVTINEENINTVLKNYSSLIGHIHASEPNLLPLGDGGANHKAIADVLQRKLPNHIVTIEMLATANEPHLVAIARAINVAMMHYRGS